MMLDSNDGSAPDRSERSTIPASDSEPQRRFGAIQHGLAPDRSERSTIPASDSEPRRRFGAIQHGSAPDRSERSTIPASDSEPQRRFGAIQRVATSTPTGNVFDKYGSSNPIEQRMMRGFMAALDSMLDGLAPTRILEVGVGEGHVMRRVRERFPHVPLIGLDLPDDALAESWHAERLPCTFGDATTLPFPDGAFDLVLAIEVLEHVPGPDAALAELARVGTGTLVASVPFEPIWRAGNLARRRYVGAWGNTPGHVNHWSRWAFRRFVARRFTVEQIRAPLPWTILRATV